MVLSSLSLFSSYVSCFTQLHFLVIVDITCFLIFYLQGYTLSLVFDWPTCRPIFWLFTGLILDLLPHFPHFHHDIRSFLGKLLLVNITYLRARPIALFTRVEL